jgi:hypothetical protein
MMSIKHRHLRAYAYAFPVRFSMPVPHDVASTGAANSVRTPA